MNSPKILSSVLSKFSSTTALILVILLLSSFSGYRLEEVTRKHNEEQNISSSLARGMYVVVGSFKFPENAARYANSIKVGGRVPQMARNPENGLYYVVGYSAKEDLQYAREKRAELRSTSRFYNAWILYVGLSLDELLHKEEDNIPQQLAINEPEQVEEEVVLVEETKEQPADPTPTPVSSVSGTYKYQFNVINATSKKKVEGNATIVDAARSKTMKKVSTNEVHELDPPSSASKEIVVLCDIFGYVKDQVLVKIDNPMSSEDKSRISQSRDVTTIQFELSRNRVGDVLTMYNVYFYRNSALMKPESKFELNSLLEMLQENEKLEIRIHGHTNGNAAGKIIKLKDNDDNFFEITDNNDEKVGSAKALSYERAKVIQRWLLSQGIDKKRMEMKGWGGKKMLYGKTDSMAGKNVRVEIEIVKG